jgi:hypothetical protein
MLDEHGREFFCCFSNGELAGMRGIGTSRTMNEQHGWRRTGKRWPPQKRFEAQIATRDHNGLRRGRRRLANRL